MRKIVTFCALRVVSDDFFVMILCTSEIYRLQEISTDHNVFQRSQKYRFLGLKIKGGIQVELTEG